MAMEPSRGWQGSPHCNGWPLACFGPCLPRETSIKEGALYKLYHLHRISERVRKACRARRQDSGRNQRARNHSSLCCCKIDFICTEFVRISSLVSLIYYTVPAMQSVRTFAPSIHALCIPDIPLALPSPVNSLHILLPEIDQDAPHRTLPRLRCANAHVGIARVLRSILRNVSVREAYAERRRRVAHEERSPRHVRHAVRIGVGGFEQLRLCFL